MEVEVEKDKDGTWEVRHKRISEMALGTEKCFDQLIEIADWMSYNYGLCDEGIEWCEFARDYTEKDNKLSTQKKLSNIQIVENKISAICKSRNDREIVATKIKIFGQQKFEIDKLYYKNLYDELLSKLKKESEDYFDSLNKSNLKADSIINEQESKLVLISNKKETADSQEIPERSALFPIKGIDTETAQVKLLNYLVAEFDELKSALFSQGNSINSTNLDIKIQKAEAQVDNSNKHELIEQRLSNLLNSNQLLQLILSKVEDRLSPIEADIRRITMAMEQLSRNQDENKLKIEDAVRIVQDIRQNIEIRYSAAERNNREEFDRLSEIEKEYCNSFLYIFLAHLKTFRSEVTGHFIPNLDSTTPQIQNQVMTVFNAGLAAFQGTPVSTVGNYATSLYDYFRSNQFEDRTAFINRLLLNSNQHGLFSERDISIMLEKVALAATSSRKKQIDDAANNREQDEGDRFHKGIKWVYKTFTEPQSERIWDTDVKKLASRDVLIVLAGLYNHRDVAKYSNLETKLLHLATHIDRTDGIIEMIGMIGAVSEEKDMALSEKNAKDAEIALLKAQLQQNQYKDQNLDHVESPSFSKCLSCLFLPFHYFGRLMGLGGSKAKSKHDDTSKINIKTTEDVVKHPIIDYSSGVNSNANTSNENPAIRRLDISSTSNEIADNIGSGNDDIIDIVGDTIIIH